VNTTKIDLVLRISIHNEKSAIM